jgi:hypothetical protein
MKLHSDDWMHCAVCEDCLAVPCRCQRLTRLLERLSLWLDAWIFNRHTARQMRVNARARKARRRS